MISPLPRNQRAPHPGHEKTAVLDETAAVSEELPPLPGKESRAVTVSENLPPLESEGSVAEFAAAPEIEQKTAEPFLESPLIPIEEIEQQAPPSITEETAAAPLLPNPAELENLAVLEETPQLLDEETPTTDSAVSEKFPLLESEEAAAETAEPSLPKEPEPLIAKEPLTAPEPEESIVEEAKTEPEIEENDAERGEK